jgi:hypothetical protein
MLARSFKTATELGLLEVEYDALVTTLYALERSDKEISFFNMKQFIGVCGTPSCMAGWAYHFSGGAIASSIATDVCDERGLSRRAASFGRFRFGR